MAARGHHLRGEDAGRAVERREGLVELGHVAADRRLALDEVDREAGVGDLERGGDAGDPAADDQRRRVDRDPERLERHLLARRAGRRRPRSPWPWPWPRPCRCGPRRPARGSRPARTGTGSGRRARRRRGTSSRACAASRRPRRRGQAQLVDVLLDQLLAEARAHERVVARRRRRRAVRAARRPSRGRPRRPRCRRCSCRSGRRRRRSAPRAIGRRRSSGWPPVARGVTGRVGRPGRLGCIRGIGQLRRAAASAGPAARRPAALAGRGRRRLGRLLGRRPRIPMRAACARADDLAADPQLASARRRRRGP